ncbi:response regulator transcription factor [Piscinibacter sp. XHJ-5]|uniref:response regulator transcription factor n=1 Tax=Piscinibacter sp. XHJ-5 TaxID=3037797 RepID=UPI0024531EBE|nr:response regulator transcription factor [Piscinibacter sp. XHJ-5]
MNRPTRLLIADDHPILRAGLRTLLSSHDDLAVVGEASDGLEAVALWHETTPDMGLFDLRMPVLDGVEALRRIREAQPQAAVIILTTLALDADIDRLVDAGARTCLRKDAGMSEIVACIRAVRSGASSGQAAVKRRLSSRAAEEPLTPREYAVLDGVARGWSNRRVADALGIGAGTVKTHLKRVYGKLYARNRTEAVVIARSKGLLRWTV